MIGFALGTSEGKEILKRVNEFTEDIVVSTATEYGAELLREFKVNHTNSKPLDKEGFRELINRYKIELFVDCSHPYAEEVSKNLMSVCSEENIMYIRYERSSYINHKNESSCKEKFVFINSYDELECIAKEIEGTILNTTGSNNAILINNLNIKNRIIHRVLPMPKVLSKLIDGNISLDNIIAMKGPFGYSINDGIIKEYNVKAIITKDSGKEGGMEEKLSAAMNNNCKIIIKMKSEIDYGLIFSEMDELISSIKASIK